MWCVLRCEYSNRTGPLVSSLSSLLVCASVICTSSCHYLRTYCCSSVAALRVFRTDDTRSVPVACIPHHLVHRRRRSIRSYFSLCVPCIYWCVIMLHVPVIASFSLSRFPLRCTALLKLPGTCGTVTTAVSMTMRVTPVLPFERISLET